MQLNSAEKQYDKLFKTLQAYQAAVNEAAIVSITDLEGKMLYVNNKFVEISKYSADELIGQTHRIVNSGYHPAAYFRQLWTTISQGKSWRGEIRNRAKDGTYYWVDTVIIPVQDQQNRIFQYLSVRNLITARKENEVKLIKSQEELLMREQQLKDAQEVSKTGSWYLNISRNSLEWSEETYRIFEIPAGTPLTYESFLGKVHPADRQYVQECWQNALNGAPYEIEHRIVTPHGEKWVRERAQLKFDEAFNLKEGIGTVQDITEKKKIEDTLKESERLYKDLFNSEPLPKAIFDKETFKFLEVNEIATKLYGYTKEEFLQLTVFDMRVPGEHNELRDQLKKGTFTWNKHIQTHRKKNGGLIHVESFITEIIYNTRPSFLITLNDVTEKLKLQEQLQKAKLMHEREISRAAIEAQEQNSAEIGRELHDNVNQLLVASTLYLKNVKPASQKEKSYLEQSVDIIISAINEIRKLSQSLVSLTLNDMDLKSSIEGLSSIFALTQTTVDFDIQINVDRLSEGLKVSIYRIIQEQFNNIIKYAEATKVRITIIHYDGTLLLEIADNGKGFDMKQKPTGIGLTNIIHRAETYNGKVNLESSPGHGCRLCIEFVPAALLQVSE